MMIDIYLTAQQIMEQTGLSAAELAALPLDEYARLSGRQTPAQAAIQALNPQYEASAPQGQEQPPAPVQEAQQPDVNAMDWQQYARWREASGIAQKSDFGTTHAHVSLNRLGQQDTGPAGRTRYYR